MPAHASPRSSNTINALVRMSAPSIAWRAMCVKESKDSTQRSQGVLRVRSEETLLALPQALAATPHPAHCVAPQQYLGKPPTMLLRRPILAAAVVLCAGTA